MVIDFGGYTAKVIEKDMLRQVPEDIDTREGSIIQTAVGPVAWYLEGLYLELAHLQANAYADTAVGKALNLIVQQRGLTRNPATPAIRKGSFNVPIPSGAQFKTINGANSVIFVSGELLFSTENSYVYAMTCQVLGIVGNNYIGNLLPITAVSDLTSATLGEIITAGTEEETDKALRERFFETFRVAAFGGNIQAYRNAILAIPGVGAVQVYPAWQGGGTVLCSILDDKRKPALAATVQTVQDIICPSEGDGTAPSPNGYGMAPIGAAVTITTAAPLTLDITCDIEFALNVQNGAETYLGQVEEKIQEYLDTVSQTWGVPLKGHTIDYAVTVYVSRIIFAVLTIPEIVNVTNVRINGSEKDLHLTETSELQQIPELGTVVINGG